MIKVKAAPEACAYFFAANLLTHDEARRMAVNFAKLPELLGNSSGARRAFAAGLPCNLREPIAAGRSILARTQRLSGFQVDKVRLRAR